MRTHALAAFGIIGIASLMACAQAETLPAHNWSGAYLGGDIGIVKGRAKSDVSTSEGFPGSYFTSPDAEQITGEANGSMSQSHMALGLFGGYGRQSGKLYLGVEASISDWRFDQSRSSGAVYLSNPTGQFTNTVSVTANGQAMLRGRLGWAQDRWLTYVTGGVAATRIKLDTSFSDDYLGGASGRDSSKKTRLGWVLGLGSAYALNDNWTIRAEYLYADYGKVNTSAFVTSPTFPTLGNDLRSSIDLKTQSLSIGVSYHF